MTKNGKKLVVKIFRLSGGCCICGAVGIWAGGAGVGGAGLATPNADGINLYTKTYMQRMAMNSPAHGLIPALDRTPETRPTRAPKPAE